MGAMRNIFLASLAVAAACGGKAAIVGTGSTSGTASGGASGSAQAGSGGTGAGSATSSSGQATIGSGGAASVSASSSATGGSDCATLTKNYQDAIDKATSCNACQDFDPCFMQGTTVHTLCGCPIGGNGDKNAAAAAESALATWKANGCGAGIKCAPCPPPGGKFFCMPIGKSCMGNCGA